MENNSTRGRKVARAGLALGIIASVAANVAHAQPAYGPRLVSGFVPVALWFAIEILVRAEWRSGLRWTFGKYASTGIVAGVTAVASYVHQRALLLSYGEETLPATLIPVGVDGLMMVATLALVSMNAPEPTRRAQLPEAPVSPAVVTIGAQLPGVPDAEQLAGMDTDEIRGCAIVTANLARQHGIPITGAALGRAYNRSDRWGSGLLRELTSPASD